jgi:hypothetical protein
MYGLFINSFSHFFFFLFSFDVKFCKVALFAASQSSPVGPPVDNELFQMSVALYKKDSTNTDISARVIPSKVGSILLTQA